MDRSDGDKDAHDSDVVDAAIQSCEHGGAKIGGGNVLFLRQAITFASRSPSVSYSVPEDPQEDQDEPEDDDDEDDIERDLSVIRHRSFQDLTETPASTG